MRMTLNATEAADALGLHRNTLQGWLRDGRIQGEKVGGEWRIPAEEVARMQKERSTLLEAGRGMEAAGRLLLSLSEKRWHRAERGMAEAMAEALEARTALTEAQEDNEAEEVVDTLRRAYLDRLEAVTSQAENLTQQGVVLEAARSLQAEGVRKQTEALPPFVFAGNGTEN
jgi:excisionase family DNA binding protein